MKCRVCGKSFETLGSLRDHHKTVHGNLRFVSPRAPVSRVLLVTIILILIAVSGVVGYFIYAQAQKTTQGANNPGLIGKPVSSAIFANLSGVSYETLAAVGPNQTGVTGLSSVPPSSVSQLIGPNGRPEVLYIGAEWCPYCAAERWSMIVALAKFGTFSNISYMESSSSDIYPNTNTFSFYGSSYTSQYISFVPVEHEDRNHNALQTPTSQQQAIWTEYTTGNDQIPFLYVDGLYYLDGAQFTPNALFNLNWTQIASQIENPQSPVAKLIDGAANQIIGSICSALKTKLWPYPQNLCNQSFANLSFTGPSLPTTTRASSWLSMKVEIGRTETTALKKINPVK